MPTLTLACWSHLMSKITLIAAAMWQEEARQSGSSAMAARRTHEAFTNEFHEVQDKWIEFAKVALKTIEENDT
jgi:hypothetical protein